MKTLKAEMRVRAERCWALMTDSEKNLVRFGMSPHWSAEEDLGGKIGKHYGFSALCGAEEYKEASLALMQLAKENGGMVS